MSLLLLRQRKVNARGRKAIVPQEWDTGMGMLESYVGLLCQSTHIFTMASD